MKICVMGLWHLGSVTAASLASVGHEVVGFDFDQGVIENLQKGQPPLFELGLEELVKQELSSGSLSFTFDPSVAFTDIEMVWVTYDTPVDEEDNADVAFVLDQIKMVLPFLTAETVVLISSQLPAGSTRVLEAMSESAGKQIRFAYSPENLRLGKAIDVFLHPDRIVVGARDEKAKEKIAAVLAPISEHIEWMSVESAEMTKHALNAFLATSVVFINEIAALCEKIGADAKEIERGLKSEVRIGPKAYLGPGGAFAGGTLARDINFLIESGKQYQQPTILFSAVKASNDAHKSWARQKIEQNLAQIKGETIAVWGLTYKPGTDTLRRSSAVELCQWLLDQGAIVNAHDPAVKSLPENLSSIHLCATAEEALVGAKVLVIATEWPEYRQIAPTCLASRLQDLFIIDSNAFLSKAVKDITKGKYLSVGKPLGEI